MIRFKWYHTAATATTLRMSNLCFLHFFGFFISYLTFAYQQITKGKKEQKKPHETRRNVTKRDVLNKEKEKKKKKHFLFKK